MKTIGLLGGMSWESTLPYYRIVNQTVAARLGGLHSARVVLYSVDFHDVEKLQYTGRWTQAGELLADAAAALERAGADFLVLCTNTMHKVVDAIESRVGLPVLHIADATAAAIRAAGLEKVALLGTRFTMEDDFYRGRLVERHGLDVTVPDEEQRRFVHRVIYDELCRGEVKEDSRRRFAEIIAELARDGAGGVILGCTEIGLLVRPEDSPVPVFDTTRIHAEKAVGIALADGS